MSAVYDQANVELFMNEVSQGQDPYTVAVTASGDDLLIGALDPSPISRFLDGDIAESIVFATDINIAQRIIIDNYLAAKYDLDISASGNDVYTMDDNGNGDFDFEVAGIGQATDGTNHRNARGTGVVRIWNPDDLDNDEYLMWGHDNTPIANTTTASPADVDGTVIEERLSRIWRMSETSDVGTVSISFDFSGTGGSPIGSNLRLLIDRDGDGFGDNDVTPVVGSESNDVVTFSNIEFQDGDQFTLGNTDSSAPLPIELIAFNATPLNDHVMINWTTGSELNNDFFTVEKSIDGDEWEVVIKIHGAGTTNEEINYETADNNPNYGISYYRLKQTDFDGQYSYSKVSLVSFGGIGQSIVISPNPSEGNFKLQSEVELTKSQVALFDISGRRIFDRIHHIGDDLNINLTNMPNGVYLLKIIDRNNLFSIIRLSKK